MSKAVAGVPANHSSTERSVTSALDHAQADDPINSVRDAANISADAATGGTYSWQSGPMNAWQENDDYREFGPGRMTAPESRTTHYCYPINDGDYDDNGGVPTAEGHSSGTFDAVRSPPGDSVDPYRDQVPIGVNAVIVRRI